MARFTLILKRIACLFTGHRYWSIIKTILPYFPDEKVRYKTYKYCVRCSKMEDE
jgi:hypothetical protein